MVLRDISYACMQASPDRTYGARVQSSDRLEENRRGKYRGQGAIFDYIDIFSAFPEAALLGATLGKALKLSIYSKIAP